MQKHKPDRAVQGRALRGEIESALRAILSSGALGQSERRSRLLSYLVGLECEGRGEEIKAYAIALDVFGRDATFDPNTDSIVRVEIGRLRDALRLYHAQNQNDGMVVIDIPKGSYRPSFSLPAAPPDARNKRRVPTTLGALALACAVIAALASVSVLLRDGNRPVGSSPDVALRIAVMPFETSGDHADLDEIAFGLYSELALDLSAYSWVSVVSPLDADSIDADYVLKNQLQWQGELLQTNSQLLELPGQRLIWSKSFSEPTTVANIQKIQSQITSGTASSLGSAHGISTDLVLARATRHSKADLGAFLCYIGVYRYFVEPTDRKHRKLRDCLESVVTKFPEFGEAWGALGLIYSDEERFGRNPRSGADSWADARKAIERGLELAPLRSTTLSAGLVLAIEAPEQDLGAALHHAKKMLELFPRHPPTLVLIGSRRAEFLGQWKEGLESIEIALQLEHSPPSVFFLTKAFHAAIGSDDDKALAATRPLTTLSSKPELLLHYLAAARFKDIDQMRRFRELMSEQNLHSAQDLADFVINRRYHQDLERSLVTQMKDAFQLEESN